MKSPICELLGIKYPIFQGGMAWVSEANLAAAVSNAGGLGIIAAGNAPANYVSEQIALVRTLTDKPFGINIMLMSPFADEVAEVVAKEKVPVVTTGAGNPSKYMKLWLEAGIKVIPVVPSTGIAKMVQRAGCCAVIAEGGESGGHVGDLTTMTLVPQVVDALKIPVIAAGGIADGRGMAAAFMLGAVGIQMGTRFLASNECTAHQNYKDKVVRAKDIDTMSTGKRLGHPVRALKTPFTRELFAKEYDSSVTNEELEEFGAGALKFASVDGDNKKGSFMCGQIAGLVKEQKSVSEIIEQIISETENILNGASKWVK